MNLIIEERHKEALPKFYVTIIKPILKRWKRKSLNPGFEGSVRSRRLKIFFKRDRAAEVEKELQKTVLKLQKIGMRTEAEIFDRHPKDVNLYASVYFLGLNEIMGKKVFDRLNQE